MTGDHLLPEQNVRWGMNGGYFVTHGFGFGMPVVTRCSDYSGSIGTSGCHGGLGTTRYCDPREHMVSILMTQAMWTSPAPPHICLNFRTAACQVIDD
jgi:CubicO group peptidase (beta-lactamase class C family)